MDDYKKLYCKSGEHKLEEPNLLWNTEEYKQCKACAYKSQNRSRKMRRDALKWLRAIIALGEKRMII